MAGELVLGYDGSDGARAALDTAVALSRETGAPLVIAFGYGVNPAGGEVADYARAVEQIGEKATGEARGIARAAGVDAEVVIAGDRPAAALVRVAAERGARMIIVGSRGEGPLTGALLGSVPHKLIHLSPVPVLVVPLGDD